jgi:hypothetical protein
MPFRIGSYSALIAGGFVDTHLVLIWHPATTAASQEPLLISWTAMCSATALELQAVSIGIEGPRKSR